MISVDEYLSCADRALDAYADIVTALGDDLVNERLDGIPGSNSAFALVAHVCGMTAAWVRTVNLGIPVPRDRDAEFVASGTVVWTDKAHVYHVPDESVKVLKKKRIPFQLVGVLKGGGHKE